MKQDLPLAYRTIGELVSRFWIWLACVRPGCGHAQKCDPADLADRLGRDYPLTRMLASCSCTRCGGRGATLRLQPPQRPDRSDAPRQVPAVS